MDSGALLPSNRHTVSLWLGGEELKLNCRAPGDIKKDGLMIRLKIHNGSPQILTTKMGTLIPRLVDSSQLQRLQAAGATLAELDAAMEAGIEGFRCNCRFAEHSNKRCDIWLPTRGACLACQVLTEREGVRECNCACTACITPVYAASFPCTCTQSASQ